MAPPLTTNPGRRILVARVTGEPGQLIQAWRKRYDPGEACRLPPHATLCPEAPLLDLGDLELQVRHAFPSPVRVRLGEVAHFANPGRTYYVRVLQTADLDVAFGRLVDGTHTLVPNNRSTIWHVTCIRRGRALEHAAVMQDARELALDMDWTIDTIAYMELRGSIYQVLAEWHIA